MCRKLKSDVKFAWGTFSSIPKTKFLILWILVEMIAFSHRKVNVTTRNNSPKIKNFMKIDSTSSKI